MEPLGFVKPDPAVVDSAPVYRGESGISSGLSAGGEHATD